MSKVTEAVNAFVDRWILNRDLDRNERVTLETLARGKEREARALHRVAVAKDDPEQERRSQEAAQTAARLRRQLETHYDMYARGRGR